jgi:hypothetical protein
MANVALSTLRTRIRERSGLQDTNVVSDSELNTYINHSIADLIDMVEKTDTDLYMTSATWTSDGSDAYSLPDDFYSLRGVEYQSGSNWYSMDKYTWENRNIRSISLPSVPYGYRVYGSNIGIIPTPSSGDVFRIWYIKLPDILEQDTDTINCYNSWDEFIIVSSVIKCHEKMNDIEMVTTMYNQLSRITDRITSSMTRRDVYRPERVNDVWSRDSEYWWR